MDIRTVEQMDIVCAELIKERDELKAQLAMCIAEITEICRPVHWKDLECSDGMRYECLQGENYITHVLMNIVGSL